MLRFAKFINQAAWSYASHNVRWYRSGGWIKKTQHHVLRLIPAVILLITMASGVSAENHFPKPENFINVVAKCAKCQPIADEYNAVRGERRTVASDAQTVASLLPSRKKLLDKLNKERAAAAKKAVELTGQSLKEKDAAKKQKLIDQSNDLVDRQDDLDLEIVDLEDEISDLDESLKKLLEKHKKLTKKLAELKAKLAECEKTCGQAETPKISVGQTPLYDPDIPQPENYINVVAKCAKCQPIADEYNAVRGERRSVASDAQTVASLLPSRKKLLDKLNKERAAAAKKAVELTGQSLKEKDAAKKQKLIDQSNDLVDRQDDLDLEIVDLEDEISDLDESLKKLLEKHKKLTKKLAELKAKLAECEKTCGQVEKPAVSVGQTLRFSAIGFAATPKANGPVEFSLSKSQPDICRVGKNCRFTIDIQNQAESPYNGPIFVMDRMPVSVRLGSFGRKEWSCQSGRRGETLCAVPAAYLKQGAKLQLDLSLKMRGYPRGRNKSNCAQVLWPRTDLPLGEDRTTVQLLQFGANENGLDAGPVDGVMGRRTRAAFETLLERSQQDKADMNVSTLVKALKWGRALAQFDPKTNLAKQCAVIKVVPPPKRAPVAKKKDRSNYRIPFSINIGIGIGGSRRHHRGESRKHPRGESEKYPRHE